METIEEILSVGGKSNSLGRAAEVYAAVLKNRAMLEELYGCMFSQDLWIRMRAADTIEKVCRAKPEWLGVYVDRFQGELSTMSQPSIQWHLAQIYQQVPLTDTQKHFAIEWLKHLLSTADVDWIVSANAMDALSKFMREGSVSQDELIRILHIQQAHKSKAVMRRADKHLAALGIS